MFFEKNNKIRPDLLPLPKAEVEQYKSIWEPMYSYFLYHGPYEPISMRVNPKIPFDIQAWNNFTRKVIIPFQHREFKLSKCGDFSYNKETGLVSYIPFKEQAGGRRRKKTTKRRRMSKRKTTNRRKTSRRKTQRKSVRRTRKKVYVRH